MDYRQLYYEKYRSVHERVHHGAAGGAHFASWGESAYARIGDWLPTETGAQVLDAGCGDGRLLFLLHRRGFANLTGVDVSPEQTALARQRVPAANIVEGDVCGFLAKHPGQYDLVLAFDIIEHFRREEILSFLTLICASLRPGGRLILQTPNAASPFFGSVAYGDFTHEWFFTPKSLAGILTLIGFDEVQTRENRPNIHGLNSWARSVAWRLLRAVLWLWDAIETGGTGNRIYSRVFVATAVKPR